MKKFVVMICLVFMMVSSTYGDDGYENTRKLAEEGNIEAQYRLGDMYRYGEEVKEDKYEAIKWYRRAASQGSAEARYRMGSMYYNSEGVNQDFSKAVEWWKKAAEQGLAEAQERLGHMYYFGTGVTKNPQEAIKWYHKSAEQGYIQAQSFLGLIYHIEAITSYNKLYSEADNGIAKRQNAEMLEHNIHLGTCISMAQV